MRMLSGLLATLFFVPAFAQTYPPTQPRELPRPAVTAGTAAACQGPLNPFRNCGFETGDFTSWIAVDLADPFIDLSVQAAGFDPMFGLFRAAPSEGTFAAVHGFDGDGPGTISIAQDVTLPIGVNAIVFDYRVGWDLETFCGCSLSRTIRVEVQPAGGGTPIQSTTFVIADPFTFAPDSGPQQGVVDVGGFSGQSVRVVFVADIPESFTGPAFFQLDNVGISVGGAVPATTPYGLAALAGILALLGFVALRRTN